MKPKLQEVVSELSARSASVTGEAVSRMFEGMEDTLLDFADKAESNEGRQGFYDAIRELDFHSRAIQESYRQRVAEGFRILIEPRQKKTAGSEPRTLSLIDKEDLENRLAVESVADRAARQVRGQLYALKQRMAVINRGLKIREQDLPGGPYQLAHAFARSLEGVEIQKRVKLLLYVLFHKQVLSNLEELYTELNERLVDAGVLPYLRPEVSNPERADGPAPRAAPSPAPGRGPAPAQEPAPAASAAPKADADELSLPASASDLVLRDVLDLIGRRRQQDAGPGASSVPSGPPVSAPELAATVSRAAESGAMPAAAVDVRAAGTPAGQIDPAVMTEITQALSRQREMLVQLAGSDRVRAVDADTIDLVGMLFEYMLGTDELPNAVKALLSHLHTPYLKLAILDQSFLDRRDHPARELLDLMIEGGSTLVVETDLRRGVFPELRDMVNRILADFTDDLSLFPELLEELRRTMDAHRQKADALEARAREAEKGRQQLRIAQQRARAEVAEILGDRSLPEPVVEFVQGFLADKLTLLLLRSTRAEGTEQWQRTTELARALVRAASSRQAAAGETGRSRLAALERVIRDERALLGSHYNRQVEAVLSWISGMGESGAAEPAAVPARRPQPEASPDPVPPSPAETAASELLERLEFGTWLELQPEGEEHPRRVKLSWYNPTTSRYMFVSQDGITAATMDRPALARAIAQNRARVVELQRRPFMERALEGIRKAVERSLATPLSKKTEKEPA